MKKLYKHVLDEHRGLSLVMRYVCNNVEYDDNATNIQVLYYVVEPTENDYEVHIDLMSAVNEYILRQKNILMNQPN